MPRRPAPLVLVLAALATLSAGAPLEPPHAAEARKDDPGERAEWWFTQRAFPRGIIPADAWARARAPFRPKSKVPRDAASIVWKAIGPAPLDTSKGVYQTPNMSPSAGRASAIVIDPSNPKTLYAGYAIGGVWKTTDGGVTWKPLMDFEPMLAVGALAIDPAAPGTLYVGTGEPAPYIGYAGQGILRSTDGGATFEKIGGTAFDGLVVSRLVLDGGTMYASTIFGTHGRGQNCNVDYDAPGQGLYRSTDGGATWQLLKAGKMIDLEVDTSVTPRRILVSDFASGAYLSEDGGSSWSSPAGLPTVQDGARRIELAFSPVNPTIVYAGLGKGNAAALYLSKDAGKSFAQIANAPDYCQAQCYYDNAIGVDPTDEKVVYLGGGLCGVWKSSNATDTNPVWANISLPNHDCKNGFAWPTAYVHPDIHGITFDPLSPSTVYFATDGGVARTTDAGGTFSQLNDGVGTLQIYALCGDPAGTGVIYGGSQDNGIFARTTTGWRGIVAADGGPCAVDSGDPNIVLASTEYASIVRTKNAFSTTPSFVFAAEASQCKPGAPGCGDRTTFIAPLVSDPSTPGTFYVGTYRVFKTAEGGVASSWKAVSPDLTAGEVSVACPDAQSFGKLDDGLTTIAVAPGAPGVLYTGSQSGRMFTTKDGGANWTRIDKAPLPGRWVTAIAVDPRDPAIVFASFSGFGDNTPGAPGHVFRSADGGSTWELRDIPADTPVNSLVAHSLASDLLYAGTDGGVLVTTDGGKSWEPLGNGFPSVPVFALVYQRTASTLVAGTFGRSAWSAPLPVGAITVSPAQLTFAAEKGTSPAAQSIGVSTDDPRGGISKYAVVASAAWLTVDRASGEAAGAAPQMVKVTATPGDLGVGDHEATITITPEGGGAPLTVPVKLTLTKATKPVDEEGGCGCRVVGERSEGAWRLLAAAALVAGLGALRRSKR